MNRRNFLKLTGITAIVPFIPFITKAENIQIPIKDDWISFKDKIPLFNSHFILKLIHHDKLSNEYYNRYFIMRSRQKGELKEDIPWLHHDVIKIDTLLYRFQNEKEYKRILNYPGCEGGYELPIYNVNFAMNYETMSWKPYFKDLEKTPALGRKVEIISDFKKEGIKIRTGVVDNVVSSKFSAVKIDNSHQYDYAMVYTYGECACYYWRYI